MRKRPLTVTGLSLLSILKVLTVLGGIAWLETYWITNPPRPDTTFTIIITVTLFDLIIGLWLWFPHRIAWAVVLGYDLLHLVVYVQILSGIMTLLTPFVRIVVLLFIVRLLLLFSPSTRIYYRISSHSRNTTQN